MQYKRLTAKHRLIITDYVNNPVTQKELAKKHGVNKETIGNLLRSDMGKEFLAEKERERDYRLTQLSTMALDVLQKLMKITPKSSKQLSLEAAKTALKYNFATKTESKNKTEGSTELKIDPEFSDV